MSVSDRPLGRAPRGELLPARELPERADGQGAEDHRLRPPVHARRGPYLYDEKGDEYLDLLAGWGVFALGRNHPKVKAALQDVLAQDLPDMVQLDVSLLAGLLAERLLRFTPATSPNCSSATPAPRQSRRRSSSAATRPSARTHPVPGARFSRPDPGRPLPQRRKDLPGGVWAAAPRMSSGAVQRPPGTGRGTALPRRGGARVRADPGQGCQHPFRRLLARGRAALPHPRHAAGGGRDPDRLRAAPASSSPSSTGASNPT